MKHALLCAIVLCGGCSSRNTSDTALGPAATPPGRPDAAQVAPQPVEPDVPDAAQVAPQPVAPERPDAAQVAPQPVEQLGADTIVRITAAEAAAHGLPAIGLSIDTARTSFGATRFPEEGVFLTLGGPPGGPLTVRFDAYRESSTDEGVIARVVRTRLSGPGYEPLRFGVNCRVDVAGASRNALPVTTGESMAKTIWCAVPVPVPPGGPEGILILAGTGHAPGVDCDVPLGHEDIARVLATLRFD